jgi:predicted nucleic acid-binding protein
MKLLDSNILIYSSKQELAFLRKYFSDESFRSAVSVVTVIEVLGFNRLTTEDKRYFESCFSITEIFEVNQIVMDKAVLLRQSQKIALGDAIVAATALVYDYELITRNISDFQGIEGLRLYNPFDI